MNQVDLGIGLAIRYIQGSLHVWGLWSRVAITLQIEA